jgi:hypothetical protein
MKDETRERIETILDADPDTVMVIARDEDSAEFVADGSVGDAVSLTAAVVRSIADDTGTDPRTIGFDVINRAQDLGGMPRIGEDLGGNDE